MERGRERQTAGSKQWIWKESDIKQRKEEEEKSQEEEVRGEESGGGGGGKTKRREGLTQQEGAD